MTISTENPLTQRLLAKQAKVSQPTINRIIKNDLEKEKRMKTSVHVLNQKDMKNRKSNCRKLYENHLAREKCRYVVTLDESWIRLEIDGRKPSFFYVKRGEKLPDSYVKQKRSLWERKFMVIAAMSHFGTFPLIRVPQGTKVTSHFYVTQVLRPLIHDHLIPSFGDNISKVFVHHDKCSVHVSKFTTLYMELMTERYGIKFIAKADIPVKGADCSPLDFFGFGYLKQRVEGYSVQNLNQLWNRCRTVWSQIRPETCAKVYEAWKKRLRLIHDKQGSHVE